MHTYVYLCPSISSCYYCCANTTPRSRKTNRTCRDPPPRIQREAHATTTTINSSNGCLVSMSPAAPSQPQLTHSYARQGSEWRGRGYTHRVREGAVHFRDVFFFGCIYPTAGWHATIVFFSLQKPGQTGPKERKPVRRRAPTVFPWWETRGRNPRQAQNQGGWSCWQDSVR